MSIANSSLPQAPYQKVILREMAVQTLSITFSRDMGNNTFRHYHVPPSELIGKGEAAIEIVKKTIIAEEGNGTEFEVIPLQRVNAPMGMQTVDASSILAEDSDIEKALRARNIKQTLYEYNELLFTPTRFQKILGYATRAINKYLIAPINRAIYSLRIKDFDWNYRSDAFVDHDLNDELEAQELVKFEKHMANKTRLRRFVARIPQIRLLPDYLVQYVRKVTPCQYLSVSYEAGDEEKAANYILNDLRKLQDAGAIMGHLAMPSMLLLCDTIGNGKTKAALFCFLFVDFANISAHYGIDPATLLFNRQPLELIGLRTISHEGELKTFDDISFQKRYQIEDIFISTVQDSERQRFLDMLAPTYDKLAIRRAAQEEAFVKAAADKKKPE